MAEAPSGGASYDPHRRGRGLRASVQAVALSVVLTSVGKAALVLTAMAVASSLAVVLLWLWPVILEALCRMYHWVQLVRHRVPGLMHKVLGASPAVPGKNGPAIAAPAIAAPATVGKPEPSRRAAFWDNVWANVIGCVIGGLILALLLAVFGLLSARVQSPTPRPPTSHAATAPARP